MNMHWIGPFDLSTGLTAAAERKSVFLPQADKLIKALKDYQLANSVSQYHPGMESKVRLQIKCVSFVKDQILFWGTQTGFVTADISFEQTVKEPTEENLTPKRTRTTNTTPISGVKKLNESATPHSSSREKKV